MTATYRVTVRTVRQRSLKCLRTVSYARVNKDTHSSGCSYPCLIFVRPETYVILTSISNPATIQTALSLQPFKRLCLCNHSNSSVSVNIQTALSLQPFKQLCLCNHSNSSVSVNIQTALSLQPFKQLCLCNHSNSSVSVNIQKVL